MRILHIYDGHERVFPGEGSVPYNVYNIAKYTAAKGCEVTILERRWNGLSYKETIEGILFERIVLRIGSSASREEIPENVIKNPFRLFRFILDRIEFGLKILGYLRKNNFDVVIVHLPFAANILVTLNRILRKKMVYAEQIGEVKKRLKLGSKEETAPLFKLFSPDLYLMKRVKKVVMLSESVRSQLVSRDIIKSENITTISNGVDINEFNPNIDAGDVGQRYRLNNGVIVLFASAIIPRKGTWYLVKAADIVVNHFGYKNTLFLLVGNSAIDHKYVAEIIGLIKNNGLERNVNLVGYTSQELLKKLYVASDIYVLPSFEENIPASLLEPLASGKPLISTNIMGVAPLIRDGWNGFLVEPANEQQLAEKIKHLIDHPEERESMGENSRKLAVDEFDWKKIADKYLEVYRGVASQQLFATA